MHGWIRLLLIAALAALLLPGMALAETRVMVVSDVHYLAPEMYAGSDLFLRALQAGDGKITQYSEELLSALCDQVKQEQPDALMVTGDLSFNGEKASHEGLAAWFTRIEAEGTPVWVIPGNHDIQSDSARIYFQGGWQYAASVTPEEFSSIYRDFLLPSEGGEGANLSYHVPVNDQLWLALVDVSFYQPTAQVFGLFTKDHAQWLEGVLAQARAAGAEVITCTHHSLLTHTEFSKESFLMFGHETMEKLAREYGVRLNLSGHMHIQHIAREDGLADAATGALCVSPHRYAMVTLTDEGELTYEAKALSDAFLPSGFQEMSREWFADITREKTRASLSALDIPPETLESMLAYMARFNAAFFDGTYSSDDPAWQEDEAFSLWQQYAGSFLGAYMSDVMMKSPGSQLYLSIPGE